MSEWIEITREELKRDEGGPYLHAYPDPISPMGRRLGKEGVLKCAKTGYLPPEEKGRLRDGFPFTVGFGHAKPWVKYGVQITEERAEILLDNDIKQAVADAQFLVTKPVFDSLNGARKSVLVNMAFNLGRERLGGFVRMLQAVKEGRFQDASLEMANSRWAAQVRTRAARLIERMRTGVI